METFLNIFYGTIHLEHDNVVISTNLRYEVANFVHFSLKIWHLVATISVIFMRINWPNLLKFPSRGKLSLLGLTDHALNWIISFLIHRPQVVKC